MSRPEAAPDLSTWPTKQETAKILNVSTKTVEKFATDGKLQQAKRPQTGKPAVNVYHPGDIERLRQERQPPAYVVPANGAASEASQKTSHTSEALALSGGHALIRALADGLREHFESRSEPRLFLSIKEAAAFSNLPQTLIQKWIREGKLQALKTGRGWRIRRKDLENL